MSREIHLETWGKPLFDAIRLRSPGVDVEKFRAEFSPLIKQAVESGRLDAISDENLQALDDLRDLGLQIVIVTSREHAEIQHMLGPEHPLNERMTAFYYRDNMQYHKPDPRAFAHIEAEHGWKPDECIYVGDSVSDAQASLGANIPFVASLESGLRSREDFDAFGTVKFIDKFPQIVDVASAILGR